ncbi:MAG TPA: serine hydrolase, partial [Burkholderiaceae bacterium]|nr:serine hydrolase [Burkholderiaceae bacterium]
VWLGAHAFTDRSQLARAIAWMESDVDDQWRFPSRPIANAPPRFDFKEPAAAVRRRVEAALEEVGLGAKAKGRPFAEFMHETETLAFLVVRDDELLYEGYFNGATRESSVTSFSVAKSFVSALVGCAIADGSIGSVEDPVTRYVPELLERDARYRDVRLRHLLAMSSGIRYIERGLPWSDDSTTYYAPDLRAAAVSSPIDGPPGQSFHYNNFHPLLLGLVIERATKRSVARYLEERLWKPLGMEAPASWSLDSERSGFEKMESGINARAIDFAKFGRLFLNRGRWNGVQVIPEAWVEESTRLDTASDPAPKYQYLWWVNARVAPRHHFFAAGKYGQFIYVMPEKGLVFVRFGRADGYGSWPALFERLGERIATSEH